MSSWACPAVSVPRGADESEVGPQGFAHFSHVRFQPSGQSLAFGDQIRGIAE